MPPTVARAFAFALIGLLATTVAAAPPGADTPEGLFSFPGAGAPGARVEVPVLFTNDLHGFGFVHDVVRPGPDERAGGLFSLATLVGRCRLAAWRRDPAAARRFLRSGRDDGVLLLDAGDQFCGTWDDCLSEGQNTAALMRSRSLDFDATTMGNHADAYGVDGWRAFVKAMPFPVVLTNGEVEGSGGQPGGTVPWLVREVSGLRVGLIGLAHPRATRMPGIVVTDPVEAMARAVPALRGRSEVVIAICHLGLEHEPELRTRIAALGQRNPAANVDVVVDAHSHANLAFMLDDDTLVVQAGCYGALAGELNVRWDVARRRVASVEVRKRSLMVDHLQPSARMLAQFEDLARRAAEENAGVVVDGLEGMFFACRTREDPVLDNPVGDIVSRAVIETPVTGVPQQPEIGLVTRNYLRDHLTVNDAGAVTNDLLHRVLPFEEKVVVVSRTGAQLREAAAKGLGACSWAGLRVTCRGAGSQGDRPRYDLLALEPWARAAGRFVPIDDARAYRVGCTPSLATKFLGVPASEQQLSDLTLKELVRRFLGAYRAARGRYFTAQDALSENLTVRKP